MYRSFQELAEKKYARMLSRNAVTRVCNQIIDDMVKGDAYIEKQIGSVLVIKCKNSSVASFLKVREKGILDALKLHRITALRYKF
ncbi:MAG: DUF721 domain-containing protein [Patescibacteria group bacterium]|nr:DUF721 domain-containing protein [Patescibacteria group bacterium]MDE2438499.1 DUF721 domain-containing protein [Patescibacteria group bacterium]